ncbi:MAG: efflux transporter outer membrane subunit [Parachlamydiaceae bacterium]|nr:efflux transporter outer membrane subunit [Parachlamydiaceae bacterium]
MNYYYIIPLLMCVCLVGCRVGPQYHPPCVEAPQQWKNDNTAEAIQHPLPPISFWWEVFQDDVLNDLEVQAIMANPDLFIAMARVEEAWAVAGIRRADLFPKLNLNPSYSSTGILYKAFIPPGLPFGNQVPDTFRIHQMQYNLPLNMIYEVDLWGKYRSQYESAFDNAQAQEEAYQTVLLTLTSNLASSYYHVRFLDAVTQLLLDTIHARRNAYNILKTRYDKGLINFGDVANAALELTNTESEYYEVMRQRGLQENIIATLIGVPASDFEICYAPFLEIPPAIPAGIPSRVLQRRPDIAQAEREMASEHAQVNVAHASFYPDLELTGTLGFSSPVLKDFLTWKSRLWSIGANVAQTVFDAGRKTSDLEAAWARFDQASGTYQKQVLVAFQEVEDALNDLEFKAKQSESLKASVSSATQATQIASNRYKQGLVSYIDVVYNERSQIDVQRNYVGVLRERYQATIRLIKALGGCWDQGDSVPLEPLPKGMNPLDSHYGKVLKNSISYAPTI